MDSLKRNSLFRSLSMSMKDKGRKREGNVREMFKDSQKHVSSSLDNMVLELSRGTLKDWGPGENGSFSRTEGMQCLIIPDKVLFTEIVRQQRSFSLNYGCDHCNHDPVKSNNDKKLPLSRSASMKTPTRKSLTNAVGSSSKATAKDIKSMPRSQTVHSFRSNDRKSESEVQLKRCLSLYDRKRTPHACCHNNHTESYVKTPQKKTGNSLSPRSKDTPSRARTSSSMSLDSVGLSNGRASSMSITSKSSSDFDFDHSPRTAKVSSASSSKRRSNDVDTLKSTRPSQIPRPVTPASELVKRSRSFTVSGTNPVDMETDYKRNYPRSLKKSQSFKEKPRSGLNRSAPSSAAQTPSNIWRANDASPQHAHDLSKYIDSLDAAAVRVPEKKKAVCINL